MNYLREYGLLIVLFLFSICSIGQTFTIEGKDLYDYYGYYYRQEFRINVEGLPKTMSDSFGLEKVCINLHHDRISDLKITLQNPYGSGIWLTNRNGKDDGQNYINTCFTQNGADGFIHRATPPYSGTFIPDGQMENLNDGSDPNGVWIVFIEDLREGISGKLDSISLTFGNEPAVKKRTKGCGRGNYELCECPDGTENCELLPDLVILPAFTDDQIKEYPFDDKYFPGQLRFATTIANIGYGPIEVVGTEEWVCDDEIVSKEEICEDGQKPRQRLQQRIFMKSGDSLISRVINTGTLYFDDKPGHDHYHVDDWVEFRLIDPQSEKLIIKGKKVSFCLYDTGACSQNDDICKIDGISYEETMPNFGLGSYSTCDFLEQGLSVGGYDAYGLLYEGQYLQLPKGLKAGNYWLEIEVDPTRRYVESNTKNNTYCKEIYLSKQ